MVPFDWKLFGIDLKHKNFCLSIQSTPYPHLYPIKKLAKQNSLFANILNLQFQHKTQILIIIIIGKW